MKQEDKINVAELLKDCPDGMELDCTIWDNVTFIGIEDIGYINIIINTPCGTVKLSNEGCFSHNCNSAKCVIFPKGKTSWEGFVPPCEFKDGDVLFVDCADKESDGDVYKYIFILKEIDSLGTYFSYCHLSIGGFFPSSLYLFDNSYIPRLATEEEKEKLFQAIKDNGYRWNPDNKTLEIKKFNITTLKPFESKVLVRDYDNRIWIPTFWGKYLEDDSNCRYLTTNGCYKYCIPYEGNEHLSGETDDCDEYFKTWK